MKKQRWFKAKEYGWGWQPVTWQGWSIVFLWACAIAGAFYWFDGESYSASDTLGSFVPFVALLTALLAVVSALTGEKPEWRWAGKKVPRSVVLRKTGYILGITAIATFVSAKILVSTGTL
ncbi:MAG: hypothetical protein AAB421_04985 [Patescibacteria group bacterium]